MVPYKMDKLAGIARIISICLLLFTGINAIIAGLLFILDPSGKRIGMSTSYLSHSPFQTFLIPGITLFVVNGLFNIISAISAIKKNKDYPVLIIFQGLILSGWIIIQVAWVKDFNALHCTMLLIGVLLLTNGFILKRELEREKLIN